MCLYLIFVTVVCVLFLIKLRWPNKKSIYNMRSLYPEKDPDSLLQGGNLYFGRHIGRVKVERSGTSGEYTV